MRPTKHNSFYQCGGGTVLEYVTSWLSSSWSYPKTTALVGHQFVYNNFLGRNAHVCAELGKKSLKTTGNDEGTLITVIGMDSKIFWIYKVCSRLCAFEEIVFIILCATAAAASMDHTIPTKQLPSGNTDVVLVRYAPKTGKQYLPLPAPRHSQWNSQLRSPRP